MSTPARTEHSGLESVDSQRLRRTIGRPPRRPRRSPVYILELVFDPFFYVGLSVSEMSAYSEAWWALSSVSPLVKRARRHPEIVGEFLDGQQPFLGFHGRTLQPDPFSRMSFGLSVTLQLHSYTGVGRLGGGF